MHCDVGVDNNTKTRQYIIIKASAAQKQRWECIHFVFRLVYSWFLSLSSTLYEGQTLTTFIGFDALCP